MSYAGIEFIGDADDGTVTIRAVTPSGADFELRMDYDEGMRFANELGSAIRHGASKRSDDMTGDFAAWTAETAEPEAPEPAPQAASWLPASVQRAQALEAVAEAREARAAERERADQAEQAHDRSVAAYVAAAAMRGEPVAPMDAATGNVGRDLLDVLEAARGDLARDYAPEPPADERFYGEPRIQGAQRSGWPGSEFELDRLISRAQDSHHDLVAYKARRNYADTLEAARAKSVTRHDAGPGEGRVPMIFRR
jgi:hypothetical protein